MSTAQAKLAPPATGSPAGLAVPTPEDLRNGLLHTEVSPRIAWSMIVLFAAVLATVPLGQFCYELARREPIQLAELFRQWPTKQSNRLFEESMDNASWARGLVRQRVQYALLKWGHFGNPRVVMGDGGTLYFAPGVDYVTDRGFLRPDVREQRIESASRDGENIWPDPRPAVLDFNRELTARGIHLILMPIADKAMFQGHSILNNPDYAQFINELHASGIDVVETMPAAAPPDAPPPFLKLDTHWTPDRMEQVASQLADHIRQSGLLPDRPPIAYKTAQQQASDAGDLVRMLQLPPGQTLFSPQTVTVSQVTNADSLWQGNRNADVLLLGDSFANIYSDPNLGWGEAAGLPEHLSLALKREVDVVARNDGGSYGSRAALAAELARGRDRLAGKKIVIWEFAMRELACGDWRPIAMTLGTPRPANLLVPPPGKQMVVSGVIEEKSALPRPGVPYKDHIMAIVLDDVRDDAGTATGTRAMVYIYSMRDGHRTEATKLRVGQKVKLKISSWDDVARRLKIDRITRSDISDTSMIDSACWGELIQ
jgi:alginate O-acetyltransferase complex protein AlgJ